MPYIFYSKSQIAGALQLIVSPITSGANSYVPRMTTLNAALAATNFKYTNPLGGRAPVNLNVSPYSGFEEGGPQPPAVPALSGDVVPNIVAPNLFPGSGKDLTASIVTASDITYPTNFPFDLTWHPAAQSWNTWSSNILPWQGTTPPPYTSLTSVGYASHISGSCTINNAVKTGTIVQYSCIMDGTATIEVYQYNTATGLESRDLYANQGPDDATAVSVCLQILGLPAKDGATGGAQINVGVPSNIANVSLNIIDKSDTAPVHFMQLVDYEISSFSMPPTSNTGALYYVMAGGGGGGLPGNGAFSFPTGIPDDTKKINWSFPALKTRIPFQNYCYSVANVRLKGK